MRVYFVSHSATRDHLGGAELSLLHIVERWTTRDSSFQPVVISPARTARLAVEAEARGWETIILPYEGWAFSTDPGGRTEAALRAHRDFQSTLRLIQRMQADRPDLVVTNTVVAPWGAYAAGSLGIPHVWFVREFTDTFTFPAGREQSIADIGLLSVKVVANSHAVASTLRPFIEPAKIEVVYPPVDVERLKKRAAEPLDFEPFPAGADLRIAFVGRITRPKGQWRIVEALGRLRGRNLRIAVCFVGSEVEADAIGMLNDRARRLGIERWVRFAGELDNPAPVIRAADICITASDREPFGRATAEYLALGKPVIAAKSGGTIEQIVDGESGFLVERDDLDAWAARIEQYARDSELVAAHGRAAARSAARLGAARSADIAIDLLVEASAAEGYQLPQTVVSWLRGPSLFVPRSDRALRWSAESRRFVRRLRRALRHPVDVSRRRWLRLRQRLRGRRTSRA